MRGAKVNDHGKLEFYLESTWKASSKVLQRKATGEVLKWKSKNEGTMIKIQNLLKTHNFQTKLTNLNVIQLQKVEKLSVKIDDCFYIAVLR